jgi:hypothetical protein
MLGPSHWTENEGEQAIYVLAEGVCCDLDIGFDSYNLLDDDDDLPPLIPVASV